MTDRHEKKLLSLMEADASAYIAEFRWAPPIADIHLCFGVGKVIELFLVSFTEPVDGSDDRLWVVVGDLPSAYLVVNDNDDPRQAMAQYCDLMADWCSAVEQGSDMSEVFPVSAPAALENAGLLRSRIAFIRHDLLGQISDRAV